MTTGLFNSRLLEDYTSYHGRFFRAAIAEYDSLRGWSVNSGGFVYLKEDGGFRYCNECSVPGPVSADEGKTLLFLPGFADMHLHWVQNGIKHAPKGQLLDWLRDVVFPEEARFASEEFAREKAGEFVEELHDAGIIYGGIYSSSHFQALDALAEKLCGYYIFGNAIMTENCPDELKTDPEQIKAGIEKYAERYGKNYAVTPRFGLSQSENELDQAIVIAREHNLFIQTHLSENKGEIEAMSKLHPGYSGYTDFYLRHNVLSPATLLAHCIHMSDEELGILKDNDSVIVHCPTSNIALGSGRMKIEKILPMGIRVCLGSDIGAGPELSMFDVMRTALGLHREFTKLTAGEVFYLATIGGRQILADSSGSPADFIVVEIDRKDFSPESETLFENIIFHYDNEDIKYTFINGYNMKEKNLKKISSK